MADKGQELGTGQYALIAIGCVRQSKTGCLHLRTNQDKASLKLANGAFKLLLARGTSSRGIY